LRRLLQKLIWAKRTYGAAGAARICWLHLGEALSRFTPAGRRALEREIEFDRARGVDTRGTISLFELAIDSPNVRSGLRHETTRPDLFHSLIGSLPIDFRSSVFVDLGSGKGRAVLLASEYPFKRVVGVEFSRELHAIALRNIAVCDRSRVRCGSMEVLCQDAVQFDFPAEPLVIYLYNPFLAEIVRRVVERLERSLESHPRPVFVIYANPVAKGILDSSRSFVAISSGAGWAIYAGNHGGAAAGPRRVDPSL
jgi:SAM-dependent methyltransferase